MTTYTVTWQVQVDADSPLLAAIEARHYQTDPATTATYFEVTDDDGGHFEVDLQRHD